MREDKCCWYPCQDHDLDPGSVFVVRVLVYCNKTQFYCRHTYIIYAIITSKLTEII